MHMYNTGNPVGSTAPKDLYDNSQVLDKLVVGTDPMVVDRLGNQRYSWAGMEYDFNNAQDGRAAAFEAFLAASAYLFIGDYGAGLNFTNRNQYTIRDGIPYRVASSTTLPYTTTGNWALEVNNFTPVSSDDILRQDLANVAVGYGAELVAKGAVRVASITGLLALTPDDSILYHLDGYHAGSYVGGGPVYWDPLKPKSAHNGGTVISNTVPWNGTFGTLAAFLAGTGETSPGGTGCYIRPVSGYIECAAFGTKSNDNTVDNFAPLNAALSAVGAISSANRPQLVLPAGDTYYATSPNFGKFSGVTIIGPGPDACRLHYTGSGHAFDINPSLIDTQFRYRIHLQGFLVDAGPSGTAGIYIENVAHSTAYQVYAINGAAGSCVLFDLRLAVLWHWDTCGMTVNYWPVTSIHAETLRLTSSPSKGQKTTACVFTNFTAEGASLAGIRGLNADECTFYGGTAESNTGRGVLNSANCRNMRFVNLAMEQNTTSDVADSGYCSSWEGGYSLSSGGFNIMNDSIQCKVSGGFYNQFTVVAGCVGASVKDIGVNHLGTGGFTDNGTDTEVKGIYDRTASAFVYPKKVRAAITVTVSPFAYINSTGRHQLVLVSGGTVTQILYVRGADTVVTGNTSGAILVAPGDGLTVSYSVAPSMSRVPMGVWPT